MGGFCASPGIRGGANVENDDDEKQADVLPMFARVTHYLKYTTLKSKQRKKKIAEILSSAVDRRCYTKRVLVSEADRGR